MKPEAIEAVIWRTLKILRVCDRQTLLSHINLTHPCTQTRLTRYLNRLHADAKGDLCPPKKSSKVLLMLSLRS